MPTNCTLTTRGTGWHHVFNESHFGRPYTYTVRHALDSDLRSYLAAEIFVFIANYFDFLHSFLC